MIHTARSRETAKLPRLGRPALTALRLAWVLVVVLYAAVYIEELPVVMAQLNNLDGAALRTGYMSWSHAGMTAAVQAAGLSVAALAGYRLALQLVYALGFVSLGLLIFWRRSDEWIGLFTSLFLVTFGFDAGFFVPDANPALMSLFSLMVGLPWYGFFFFFFVYPDGHFVPRWAALWSLVLLALIVYASLFPPPWFVPLVITFFVTAVLAQIYRYAHAADAVQRAQIRWMVFAIAVIAGIEVIFQGLVPGLFPVLRRETATGLIYGMFLDTGILLYLVLPFALTIAVFRYRLWDIDVLIRRTLLYSVLTGLLALAYFGTVVVLQNILRVLTGQGQNGLVTVVSTLAIAGLFVPLRRRVQAFTDQRFYRRKYDAARILADFGASA